MPIFIYNMPYAGAMQGTWLQVAETEPRIASYPESSGIHGFVHNTKKEPIWISMNQMGSLVTFSKLKNTADLISLQLARLSKRLSFCFGRHNNRKHQTNQEQA